MLVNAIRAHLAELGIVAPVGLKGLASLLAVVADPKDERVPHVARSCLVSLAASLAPVGRQIAGAELRIHAWHRSDDASRRLEAIPGIGPIGASARASVTEPSNFKSGRELAAWIGLVPNRTRPAARRGSGGSLRVRPETLCRINQSFPAAPLEHELEWTRA